MIIIAFKKWFKVMAWGLLIPTILVGCSFDSDFTDDCGMSSSDESNQTYISLSFSAPTRNATRSDSPTGGEEGDGSQNGLDNEYSINKAAIFLYVDDDEGKGVNGDGDTRVTLIKLNEDKTNRGSNIHWKYDNNVTTATFSVPLSEFPDAVYHIIVEANWKDLSWAENAEELTLGDVRDHIEPTAWDEDDNGNCSLFLMTSENDNNTLELNQNDTESNPATATVEVERMAAQVAYKAIEEPFEIKAAKGGDETYEDSEVTINKAVIINNLTSGSYLLKRVTEEVDGEDDIPSGDVIYLGDEKADDDDIATNYVLDPWTTEKNGTDVSNITGLSYGEYYPGKATEEKQKDPAYWDGIMKEGKEFTDDDGNTWLSVGYTMENTTFASYTNKKYATGLVFQAQFKPAEVTSPYYEKNTLTTGETFFKWNGVLYATAEDMMATAYSTESTQFSTDKFANQIDDCTYWSEVETFAKTLLDDDPTGYKTFLLDQASEYKDDNSENGGEIKDKSSLKWVNYMSIQFNYEVSEEDNTVTISREGVKSLNNVTDGAVQAFWKGQCYYTWWIRHSNNNDDENNGVMEYAIVRNNIYYLRVVSVYTLGGFIPTEGLQCEMQEEPVDM